MSTDDGGVTPFQVASSPTLPSVVDAYADLFPDQLLVASDERDMTAAEFREACRELAKRFQNAGLPKGAAVGVLMPNGWKWMVAVTAIAHAGLVAVPLNTWYKASELASASTKTHLRTIVSQPDIRGRDNIALLEEAGLLDTDDSREYLGALIWETDALPAGWAAVPRTARSAAGPVSPEDTAMYVFTSGSSAEPKVVVLQHGDLLRNGFEMGRRQQVVSGDRLWLGTPLFFGYGCANALTVALTHGVTLCLQERFDPWDAARFIEERACTVYYGLGPISREIVNSGALAEFDLSSLRTGAIGLSTEEKRLALVDLGVTEACSLYGLTECYGLCAMTEPGDDLDTVLHTQGRPLPNHQIRCVDPETGTVQASGDATALGEIQLRGCTTPGYLEDPAANAAAFTADGWYRTGDLGWIDTDGRLHFAGRLKEVVKINGITISPAEIETYVTEHPHVAQAHAFGWPTGTRGEEELCCAVVLKPGTELDKGDADDLLRAWLKERISSYKVPKLFIALEAGQVPMTATGKVSKRLIGEQYVRAPGV